MQPDMLEAMFVQREELARRIVDQIQDSVLTAAKNHILLIGPRGIGKSHLVSLIHHRIAGKDDLRDRALIAWLREEEWGVTSFLDLLLRILRALSEKYANLIPTERLLAIQRSSRRVAEQESEKLLRELLASKVLVLIVENLDDLFSGFGTEGQQKLRAYLQDNQNCTMLATAQSLFKGVSLHSSPFYGFFRIQHLAPLEFEDAVRLIANIANWLQDSELAAFIKTPVGRARLRAVHHLAGGNHRVYVIFAEFLTRDSLDELVSPFLRMLDDLTPYYQARMAWLSPYQRKIVEYLCEQRGALPVKEIAQGCFISPQSASSQLKILRDMGYVESTTNKRESFYELREPLMRLCIELKKNRGGPIRLLVDFLRSWHSRTELQQRLGGLHDGDIIERQYLSFALQEYEQGQSDLRLVCLDDYHRYAAKGDAARAIQVAEELVAIRGDAGDLLRQIVLLDKLNRYEEVLAATDKIIELDPKEKRGWRQRASALHSLNRYEEMLAATDKIIELDSKDTAGWWQRLDALGHLERYEEVLAATDKIIELDPKDIWGWRQRANVIHRLKRYEEMLIATDKIIELDPNEVRDWLDRLDALVHLARYEEALAATDKVIELNPKEIRGWGQRANTLHILARYEEALAATDKVIELNPKEIRGWGQRASTLHVLARYEEMLAAADKAIELDPKEIMGWKERASALSHLDRYEEAVAATDKIIELEPKDIGGWRQRASALRHLARYEDALATTDKIIELEPNDIDAWLTRAAVLITLNRWDEVLSTLETSLCEVNRTKGETDIGAERILIALLKGTADPGVLRERVSALFSLYARFNRSTALSSAFVDSVGTLMIPTITPAVRQSWLKAWQQCAGEVTEFQIPLRLLNAAVGYADSRDERVLLELPSEERRILAPLLGLEAHTTDGTI
jgi:tetratricopeptide (TPR) repeat protein